MTVTASETFDDVPIDETTLDTAREANSASQIDESTALAGKSILIVDDNEINREIAEMAFDLADAVTTLAVNADEALEKTKVQRFDLIVLDLCMPGTDPMSFTTELRKAEDYIKTPIIICSAQTEDIIKAAVKLTGAIGYCKKPIAIDELLKMSAKVV